MNYNLIQFPWTEINCSSAPVNSSPSSSLLVVVGVWFQVTVCLVIFLCVCVTVTFYLHEEESPFFLLFCVILLHCSTD